MDIAEQLSAELSRRNTDYIANYIGNDPELFKQLMNLVFEGKTPLPLRAAWVVSAVTDKYPKLFNPYLKQVIDRIKTFEHPGIRRNLLRYLSGIELPEEYQGKLFDVCYQYLLSRHEPSAIKVHAMQILANTANYQPDLKHELKLIFEELITHESAAIRSRSKQLIKKL